MSLVDLGATEVDSVCISVHAVVAIVDYDAELGTFVFDDAPTAGGVGPDYHQFAYDRNWSGYFIYPLQVHL